MLRVKKAGGGNPPATTTRQQRTYPIRRRMSTRNTQKLCPGRFPQKSSANQIALGLLVLGRQQPDLSACDRKRGWAMAERWLDAIVEARLRGVAHRRHLAVSQLAMYADKKRDYYEAEAKKRMLAGKKSDPVETLPQGDTGKARDQVGKSVGVSGRTMDKAVLTGAA